MGAEGEFPVIRISQRRILPRALEYLKEYKEVLAIAGFVAGGILWTFGYFVSKSQFEELKCFSKNSIIANRETMRIREGDEAILDRSKKFEDLVEKQRASTLTDAERKERKKLELEIAQIVEQKRLAQGTLHAAQSKLDNSDCLGLETK